LEDSSVYSATETVDTQAISDTGADSPALSSNPTASLMSAPADWPLSSQDLTAQRSTSSLPVAATQPADSAQALRRTGSTLSVDAAGRVTVSVERSPTEDIAAHKAKKAKKPVVVKKKKRQAAVSTSLVYTARRS
jgi:hypothetical protein